MQVVVNRGAHKANFDFESPLIGEIRFFRKIFDYF